VTGSPADSGGKTTSRSQYLTSILGVIESMNLTHRLYNMKLIHTRGIYANIISENSKRERALSKKGLYQQKKTAFGVQFHPLFLT
jgi:hypothetical protein